ncbi:MAG: branched-chain amino acid ABC transporter permease [Pseudomonadota bacterium]
MKKSFFLPAIGVIALGILLPQFVKVSYFYFAGYVVLQFMILSSAWNLLGGYTGYVNFGVGGFYAIGAYTSAAFILFLKMNLIIGIIAGGVLSGLLGLGLGYLTIRVRGIFFAISTLAVAIIIQMIIVNSIWLGGASGLYIFRPEPIPPFSDYLEFLFALMLFLAFLSVMAVRYIEKSWIGKCFIAIRDSEEAAECAGVPTFKLKLFATTLSGFMMGVAGAPFPYYITYLEPYSAMDLMVTVNSLAMPLVGGTAHWLGPVIGSILLGSAQQIITVTISSVWNVLIVGIVLIGFVILAPEGIIGLIQRRRGQE